MTFAARSLAVTCLEAVLQVAGASRGQVTAPFTRLPRQALELITRT